jgi:hypothetical protein
MDFDVDKTIRALSGALLVWRFLPEDDSAATSIHRCFQQEAWREASLRDRVGICAAVPFVPLVTLGAIALFTSLNGRSIKQRTGKGILRQMREQLVLASRSAIPPPWYYIFELHDDDKGRRAAEFLNRWEMKSGLFRFLRNYNGGLPCPSQRSTDYLRDKAWFAERCRQFDLATVPILLIVAGGRNIPLSGNRPGLPEVDLFVKPMHGRGGRNTERWDYQGSGQFRSSQGCVASAGDLLQHLKRVSRREPLLVQPRLVNHPEVADLSSGALATVRVMSCRNERGEAEVTNAVLRMARRQESVVDNFHAGGIAANVNITTGELGRATGGAWGATAGGWFDRHPETGAPIRGRTLPCWKELIDLARRTHQLAFSDQVVFGWDIALLPDGPCVVEANKAPDLDIIQRVGDGPIGNQRLGQLLALNLRRAVEAKYAANRLRGGASQDVRV